MEHTSSLRLSVLCPLRRTISEQCRQSHDGHHIDVPNCEWDGQIALATKDVVIRHPTDPDLFKIVGRLDDQLVLSTGEKVC